MSNVSSEKKDLHLKAYEEACEMIRHYSSKSFNVRGLSIAQGLVLLTAWALNFGDESFLILVIPVFGLVFTWLLYKFYKGYYDATEFYYELVGKMELELFEEGFRPFHNFDKAHDKKYKNWISRVITLDAPFTFIAFYGALVISIIKCFIPLS